MAVSYYTDYFYDLSCTMEGIVYEMMNLIPDNLIQKITGVQSQIDDISEYLCNLKCFNEDPPTNIALNQDIKITVLLTHYLFDLTSISMSSSSSFIDRISKYFR